MIRFVILPLSNFCYYKTKGVKPDSTVLLHYLKLLLLPLPAHKSVLGGLLTLQVWIGKSIRGSMGVHRPLHWVEELVVVGIFIIAFGNI